MARTKNVAWCRCTRWFAKEVRVHGRGAVARRRCAVDLKHDSDAGEERSRPPRGNALHITAGPGYTNTHAMMTRAAATSQAPLAIRHYHSTTIIGRTNFRLPVRTQTVKLLLRHGDYSSLMRWRLTRTQKLTQTHRH